MSRTPTKEWHIGDSAWIWNGDRPEEAALTDAGSTEDVFKTDCIDPSYPQMFVYAHVSALFETPEECWQCHIRKSEAEVMECEDVLANRKQMYAAWKVNQ